MLEIKEYTAKDLTENERQKLAFADKIINQILDEDTIDEYLAENVKGTMTKELHKETIKPFLSYLKEKSEFAKADFIISNVENNKN